MSALFVLEVFSYNVTRGSGYFVTVTNYPDPNVTRLLVPLAARRNYGIVAVRKVALPKI